MDEKTGPHPVDIHVGNLLRLRRRSLSVTQQELAKALGITFQQVQKYEKGTNRVSASMLYNIAATLKVPIAYFFQNVEENSETEEVSGSEVAVNSFLRSSEGLELAATFPKIRQPAVRRRLVDLVRAMGAEE